MASRFKVPEDVLKSTRINSDAKLVLNAVLDEANWGEDATIPIATICREYGLSPEALAVASEQIGKEGLASIDGADIRGSQTIRIRLDLHLEFLAKTQGDLKAEKVGQSSLGLDGDGEDEPDEDREIVPAVAPPTRISSGRDEATVGDTTYRGEVDPMYLSDGETLDYFKLVITVHGPDDEVGEWRPFMDNPQPFSTLDEAWAYYDECVAVEAPHPIIDWLKSIPQGEGGEGIALDEPTMTAAAIALGGDPFSTEVGDTQELGGFTLRCVEGGLHWDGLEEQGAALEWAMGLEAEGGFTLDSGEPGCGVFVDRDSLAAIGADLKAKVSEGATKYKVEARRSIDGAVAEGRLEHGGRVFALFMGEGDEALNRWPGLPVTPEEPEAGNESPIKTFALDLEDGTKVEAVYDPTKGRGWASLTLKGDVVESGELIKNVRPKEVNGDPEGFALRLAEEERAKLLEWRSKVGS